MNMPSTIVIFKLGSLGDTVMSLPFFHRIAELHPNARRVLLTNHPVATDAAPAETILGNSGLVHDFIAYPVGLRSPAKLWALRAKLKGLGADTLFYLKECTSVSHGLRDWAYFRLCGFSRIPGAPVTPDRCRYRAEPDTGFLERECERLARCLASIGPVDLKARANWDLRLTPAERATGRAALAGLGTAPCVVVNMGGKVAQNDWGAANWHALADRLAARHPDWGLFTVGAPQDRARAEELARHWRGPFADLCGRLSPRESAAAMESARLFVGHDSGPLHLAWVSGLSCVGLFSGYNPPRIWHPFIGRHVILHEMGGIDRISVHAVEDAVEEAWNWPKTQGLTGPA